MSGILLDTNVLSELMRQHPEPSVLEWLDRQSRLDFSVSAVTRAEILLGIALLPAGKRRDALADAADRMFESEFGNRCLPFDAACATEYAVLVANRSRLGQPISTEDAQIAATALRHDQLLATRNVRDFVGIPQLRVDNPWSSSLAA